MADLAELHGELLDNFAADIDATKDHDRFVRAEVKVELTPYDLSKGRITFRM